MKKVKQVRHQFHFIFLILALGFLKPDGFSQTPDQSAVVCKSCPEYDLVITPEPFWKAVSSYHGPGGCKMFLVPVIPGYRYTFKTGCGDGAMAAYDTHLELYRYSDCAMVANDDNGCELNRSKIYWTDDSESYVILKVLGNGNSYGDFILAFIMAPPCVACPVYDYDITPVTTWTTHSESISADGCRIYRVNVVEGTTYIFKTGCGNGATASFDTYLELLNMDCQTIAGDDDGCEANHSKITWTSNTTGYVYLKVRGYNGTYFGNYTLAYIACSLPGHPGTIVGNTSPCFLSSQTYYVNNQPGMTFHWTFPIGWTVTSGGTTNSVTVTIGDTVPGNIQVYVSNECGSGPISSNIVTPVYYPEITSISGNVNPCLGTTEIYSVTYWPGITYNWTFPSGSNLTTGWGTHQVTVIIGSSGNVEVTPVSSCGTGPTVSLAVVQRSIPGTPGAITGIPSPCEGSSQVYSVPYVQAVQYNWSFPLGWLQTSGGNSNSVTVTVGSGSGNILVTASNGCGTSLSASILAVNPDALPPALVSPASMTIPGGQSFCWGASQVITLGNNGPFQVQAGGAVTFIAGQKIIMLPGVGVSQNGYLHAYITTGCQYCGSGGNIPAMPLETAGNFRPDQVVIKPSFTVYPNPTTGNFVLELKGDTETALIHVEIIGILGERMMSKEMTIEGKQEFSLANRPAGVYVIHVASGGKSETVKITKQ